MVTPAGDLITNFGADDPTTSAQWDEWVSPSKMRNFAVGIHLLDWLERMNQRVNPSDLPANWIGPASSMPGYLASLDHMLDLRQLGIRFETLVWDYIRTRFNCVQICNSRTDVIRLSKATETLDEMRNGTEIIYQGVLRDHRNKIFGSPDFLIRADVLPRLVQLSGSSVHAASFEGDLDEAAPELCDEEKGWHYRIVDVKFKGLKILGNGRINTTTSNKANRIQLAAYTHGLETMQGYAPPEAYILGRSWESTTSAGGSGGNCFERLGKADFAGADSGCLQQASDAANWIRVMRSNGFSGLGTGPHTPLWRADIPTPSHDNLRVDYGKIGDYDPWGSAVRYLATQQRDVTMIPGNRAGNRASILAGPPPITDGWGDANFSLPSTASAKAQRVLEVNLLPSPGVRPASATTVTDPRFRRTGNYAPQELEFFVDFEGIESTHLENFSTFPDAAAASGQFIYMIGCGHSFQGTWQDYECFVVSDITTAEETDIFRQWFAHMDAVRISHGVPATPEPPIIHWHRYERTCNRKSRAKNTPPPGWWRPSPESTTPPPTNPLAFWDMDIELLEVEPFGVTGAFRWGLKPFSKAVAPIANALSSGSVNLWPSPSPVEHGLAASMAAVVPWRAGTVLNTRDPTDPAKFADPMIEASRVYNKVDCKIMFEVLEYLRANH
jgi:hypothetical protein